MLDSDLAEIYGYETKNFTAYKKPSQISLLIKMKNGEIDEIVLLIVLKIQEELRKEAFE